MIVTQGRGRTVNVRYRDEQGVRKTDKLTNYSPYFFITDEDAIGISASSKESGYKGVYGEDLTKILVSDPRFVYDFKNQNPHIPTWEANIPYVNRVLVDRVNNGHEPYKNYKHRIWYLDCEWSPATNKMRIIVVNDSFTGKEYVWFVDKTLTEIKMFNKYGDYTYETPAIGFPDEKDMLEHFLSHMNKQDPDIITGWFVVGADIRTIIERCRACNINPALMSPYRRINYTYKDWEQPIVGRNCIDLMIGFSKIWEMKNGKLPSYKLDDVAHEVLGEKKIELPDGHDTYLTDPPLYLHYARQDVRLLPKLDSKVNALEYYTSLQHIVQCDIRSTPFITKMFSNLVLLDPKTNLRIPTKPQFEYEPYMGAEVMEVEPSVYQNVGILDIKAMYHSNASLYNISWDTLDKNGKDCGNGTKFSEGDKGILVRQMDYMTETRNIYKKLMKSDRSNYDKWDTMQFACKSLVASMYGVAGDAKYGLYHPDVAASITYTSRATLGRLKQCAEDNGSKVLYGHTDSVFCVIDSPQAGEDLIATINATMHPIETEFEKWCSSMVLMAKNRYAGNVTWTDGQFHEPKMYIKGIEMKQSRMPPIMKEVMGNTIQMILDGKNELAVNDKLKPIITSIVNGTVDINSICMKGKLDRNLSDYKVLSGSSAGAAWANENLGKGYHSGSFFKVTLDDKGKYVAFDEPEDITGIVNIGYKILCERFVIKKVTPYYELMGWSTQPLINSMRGLGGLSWL